jgi:hypothetical protein
MARPDALARAGRVSTVSFDFKSQEGKKLGYLFRTGADRRFVMLKEAELFSEFPYPFSSQQITLFFPNSF